MEWLSSYGLADLAGISERKARQALQRAAGGKPWRGAALKAEAVKGRGGRAGVQYRVRVDSLPLDLQSRINASSKALSQPVRVPVEAAKMSAVMTVFGEMFAAIDATRPNTEARTAIYRAWSERLLVDLKGSGHSRRYSIGTLQRFYREHKEAGVSALARKGRADKGRKRVVMTARYDRWARAAGVTDLEAIAENVLGYIRGWHTHAESVSAIRLHAIRRLEAITRERGLEPPRGVCDIPLNVVKAEREYRRVALLEKDRKAFEDKSPAIRRTIEGQWPLDTIVGDVHSLDFVFDQEEGFRCYAKAICWHDVATKRLWATFVPIPKGKSIRNADVIASFMEMVAAWGLPKTLYLDNGKEYNFAEFIADAMHLNGMDVQGAPRDNAVRRARPYAARSKEIEGVFAQLRHLFPKVSGYISGDRLKSKVANVGKAPVTFKGSLYDFKDILHGIVSQHNSKPQGKDSQLAGLSPIEAYNVAVKAGWTKTDVDPDAFATVFAKPRAVAIKNGAITVKRRRFYFDGLVTYTKGDYVSVRVPKYEDWARLPVSDMAGNFLGYAEEDRKYRIFDQAGARESDRRRALQRRSVRALKKNAEPINAMAEILAFPAHATKALPAPVGARVTATDKEKAIARGLKETPNEQKARLAAMRQHNIAKHDQAAKELIEKLDARKAQ